MLTDSTSVPTRRSTRRTERRLRRRPLLVATTLTATLAMAATATAMAPAPSSAQPANPALTYALASFSTALPASLDGTEAPTTTASKADAALAKADAAIDASADVSADIADSKLKLRVSDTTVETDDLETAVAHLETIGAVPLFDVVGATEDVVAETQEVTEETSALRGQLDAAVEKEKARKAAIAKAKAKAAAKAKAEAAAEREAAEEAAEAATSTSGSGSSGGSSAPAGPATAPSGTSASAAQSTARSMLGDYGWGDDQFSCLVSLWNKESGWNYRASNPSSGAYGIPQALPGSKMSSAGSDWQTNPATQIAWGLGYIDGRYSSPCGAWGHSQSNGWY
ncbi:hypothetical protein AB3M83_04600 [Microbacterium sp. 179-B 1A2 NHS]|uniref:aggregation-promoting factor C-terminal-like domain-containing protein n=1 Tax=Microbacterium sp. 179-B 1A2 NHS TaxID=3142383 RepID=UPI0039A28E7C